ncbi:MAG: T9SS type A sorting domain-containing protein [Saprospiraceae bacterium]|nr:T9SS type A sorting domain-containing protein [Saprospiraceae bacterium]
MLYPNPVNDLLFFYLASNLSTGTLPVKIWSIDGELVHTTNWQVNTDSQLHKLSVEHLKAGFYTLVLHSEQGILVRKFIKE